MDLNTDHVHQSFKILTNIIAAGMHQSCEALDDIICVLIQFTAPLVKLKLSDVYSLVVKSLSILKKLLDTTGSRIVASYRRHWGSLKDLYSQILVLTEDASGRILYEATACITVVLSRVVLGLKTAMSSETSNMISHPSSIEETLLQIVDHARTSEISELLNGCLEASGSSFMSGSSNNMLPAACEACKSIWYLIDAKEIISDKGQTCSFPLKISRRCLGQSDTDNDPGLLHDKGPTKIIEALVKSLLESKPMHFAICHCFHNGLESAANAILQLISRICLSSTLVCYLMCRPPNSSASNGETDLGGDGTIISDMFSLLSLCAPYLNKESGDAQQKCKLSNPRTLVQHCCIALATVAFCLKSNGEHSAAHILSNSHKRQQTRLSVLAHLAFSDDKAACSIQPHWEAAMLALSVLAFLENGFSAKSYIPETALAVFPPMATLRTYLELWLSVEKESIGNHGGMHLKSLGLKDGFLGLLEARLKWGGPLAVEQACSNGIPQLLLCLLADRLDNGKNDTIDKVGVSPLGLVWTLSSLSHCLSGGVLREVLYRTERVKLITELISDEHIKVLRCWRGIGGGNSGIRDLINSVVDLLAFPFVAVQSSPSLPIPSASINSGLLLNIGSPGGRMGAENKEMVKAIEANMPKFLQVLVEVRFPACILRWLDCIDLNDVARPIAIIAKMVGYRPLVMELLKEGLLNPNRVRRLLGGSTTREAVLDFLMIVSDLARTAKDFYESIYKAGLLDFLKEFLSSEDADIRAKACGAIGNMCRHSSYFYSLLTSHGIIDILIDRCSDPDKRTRKFACFAVGNAAYHNDALYEVLRRSIPQLTKLVLSDEEDKTKSNAAGALSNLVRNSGSLCEEIVSQGALQALLKVVGDYSFVALSPNRREAVSDSPLKNTLFALLKMCDHDICRRALRSSESFPRLAQLKRSPDGNIAKYASGIISKATQT